MLNIDLAIKFGSNEIIIYRKGLGIIAKEPAYLAVVEKGKNISVKAIGKQAEKLFLSKSKDVTVYQPIIDSEIINGKMATLLIREILKDVIKDSFMLTNLSALVAVPCALNEIQLVNMKNALHEAGINKISFVQNGVCARANQEDLDAHSHIMVVDIGKYITDISVLTSYNFAFGRMYFIGGSQMDESVTTFIADNHNLEVTNMTSENIKNEVASLYSRDLYKTEYVGIDENKKYVRHDITANECRVAISNIYDEIFKLIEDVMKSLPSEISADVYNTGVMFVGGASCIPGLYEYAKKKLDLPILIPDNPSDMVILGAGKLLSSDGEFIKIKI